MNIKTINLIISSLLFRNLIKASPIEKNKSNLFGLNNAKYFSPLDESLFPKEECTTEECKKVSERVLRSLDESVDPCEDFYEFTCGGWIKDHPVNEKFGYTDGILLTYLNNIDMIHRLLKEEYSPAHNYTETQLNYDKETFTKLKNVYNTCMDVDAINKKGSQPLLDLLNDLKIYENRTRYATVEGLTDLISRLHNLGIGFLFDTSNHMWYTDNYSLVIVQNSMRVPKFESIAFTKYKKYVHDTLELVFKGKVNRNIDAMTDAIVRFEYELHRAAYGDDDYDYDDDDYPSGYYNDEIETSYNYDYETSPATDYEDDVDYETPSATESYDDYGSEYKFTIRQLKENYPFIDWMMYFKRIFKEHGVDENQLTYDTEIFNESKDYFGALDSVMWKFSIEQLAYYAEWSIIKSTEGYLSNEIQKPRNEYFKRKTENLNREEFCGEQIDEMMGIAYSKYFVDKIFNEKTEKDASNTIAYIKEAMVNRIPQMEWLDEKTKEQAIEKVFKMFDRIGYPKFIMDVEKVAEEYKDFETSSDDYFTNMMNYNYYTYGKNIKLYNKTDEDLENINDGWLMSPQTINAYYNLIENSMNFPAGIFQQPFYSSSNPDYFNYGGIAVVAGHELTHGFDNNGRNYDANGNKINWWTDKDSEKFKELSQCFVKQYSEFYVTDDEGEKYYCNGENTLGENLADNGGIARAFDAWKISIEKAKKENPEIIKINNPLLPGLSKYSFEQLFYIAFGQGWCTNATPEFLITQIAYDVHSPGKFRVNGAVMNSEHFAKTFKCAKNSPMNPKDKCLIW